MPLHAVDDDIEQIQARRGAHNRPGFRAPALRFPISGRLLAVGEGIPLNVLGFIAAQLGMGIEDLERICDTGADPAGTLAELRRIYGYRMFSGVAPGT